jgi:hypothetical protein
MWAVADLDEDYITKMEDLLELYERPYDAQQPVVCLDENADKPAPTRLLWHYRGINPWWSRG